MKVITMSVLLVGAVASADSGPRMKCRVVVPNEYRRHSLNPSPNGQPESVRYTVAYEAFWWNCVAVRATHLDGRCPFMASGTPAASAGASDGAMNADTQIDELLKKYSARRVGEYLLSIASRSEAKEKMRPYFGKPTPEPVN